MIVFCVLLHVFGLFHILFNGRLFSIIDISLFPLHFQSAFLSFHQLMLLLLFVLCIGVLNFNPSCDFSPACGTWYASALGRPHPALGPSVPWAMCWRQSSVHHACSLTWGSSLGYHRGVVLACMCTRTPATFAGRPSW